MNARQCCPECGAVWTEDSSCQDHFHQMLAWELENPAITAGVHHLMVLSYHLQHPHLYSPEGLVGAVELLVDFLERNITTEEVRRRDRDAMDSGRRKFGIKGTPESYGSYEHPVSWTMTASDVIDRGLDNYCEAVRGWARSVHEALEASANLRASYGPRGQRLEADTIDPHLVRSG